MRLVRARGLALDGGTVEPTRFLRKTNTEVVAPLAVALTKGSRRNVRLAGPRGVITRPLPMALELLLRLRASLRLEELTTSRLDGLKRFPREDTLVTTRFETTLLRALQN